MWSIQVVLVSRWLPPPVCPVACYADSAATSWSWSWHGWTWTGTAVGWIWWVLLVSGLGAAGTGTFCRVVLTCWCCCCRFSHLAILCCWPVNNEAVSINKPLRLSQICDWHITENEKQNTQVRQLIPGNNHQLDEQSRFTEKIYNHTHTHTHTGW